MKGLFVFALVVPAVTALIPFIDGGSGMPKLYDGWFNDQLSKQAATAVSKAIAAGKTKIEVNFPPVPNVDGEIMNRFLWLFPLQRDFSNSFRPVSFSIILLRGQIWHSVEPEIWN